VSWGSDICHFVASRDGIAWGCCQSVNAEGPEWQYADEEDVA
jgi:hypothetical protein